jgi:hypothetical protein
MNNRTSEIHTWTGKREAVQCATGSSYRFGWTAPSVPRSVQTPLALGVGVVSVALYQVKPNCLLSRDGRKAGRGSVFFNGRAEHALQ